MIVNIDKTFRLRITVDLNPQVQACAVSADGEELAVPAKVVGVEAMPVDVRGRYRANLRSDITVEKIREMRAQGISMPEIANRLKCHVSILYNRLSGFTKLQGSLDKYKPIRDNMTPRRFQRFMTSMEKKKQGWTIAQIAEHDKCSPAAVVDVNQAGRALAKKFKINLDDNGFAAANKTQMYTLGDAGRQATPMTDGVLAQAQ